MKLLINKPYIQGNKLISKIKYDNKEDELYFEVESEYSKYLTDDNANCFLIALLPFIIKHNYDVEIDSYISSQLYYQLTSHLLPLLCFEFNKNKIEISCKLTDRKYESNGVGAAISCGVDSFYTILKNLNCKDKKYNITHLTFFNSGSNGSYELYMKRLNKVKEFCRDNNFKLVTVNSNISDLINMNHESRHTFTTLACVYSLEKLFSKYYFASGINFNDTHISKEDSAYYDILNVHCLSNENIRFYCDGIESTRMNKIVFISNYKITYNWLNVCIGNDWNNCCECRKCIRTMTALDSIRKLDKYKNVFDINKFNKNRIRLYAKLLIERRDQIQKTYNDEIIKSCKKNGVKIPLLSYFFSYAPTKNNLKIIAKKILPNSIIKRLRK